MASQKISQFTAITSLASGDYFPVIQASGVTNKRVEVGVFDVRYTLAASGVAAQDTANQALSSGVAALASGNAALINAAVALASGNSALISASSAQASGNAAQNTANQALSSGNAALPKSGGTMTGAITFAAGQAYPQIPANNQTTAYTLAISDAGKHVNITTGGVTVPSGIFSAGDAISIYNNSGSNQTITQGSGVTLRQAGTANTGNRTLAQYGLATVLCVGNTVFVINGGGLT